MAKQIRYTEPVGYFPKSIRDKIAKMEKEEAKKKSQKKTTKKK